MIIETAYASGSIYLESIISDWQNRINNGKLITKFGERSTELLLKLQTNFRDKTCRTLFTKERILRSKKLNSLAINALNELYNQQILLLKQQTLTKFKKSLNIDLNNEKSMQLLRQSCYDFELLLNELTFTLLNINQSIITENINDISKKLLKILEEFPESSIAKMQESINNTKNSKRKNQKQNKGPPVQLSIVGMLRPAGSGLLQGIFTYATAVAGFPIDFLIGLHNDGESPEVS